MKLDYHGGMMNGIERAVGLLKKSKRTIAFTGAGISVESGIPPFRGEAGLWNTYDPRLLELDYFLQHGEICWPAIREIFYDFFGRAKPNDAHRALARLEREGLLECVVTQNIDNLHQLAGSRTVHEFHGNASRLICLRCGAVFLVEEVDLKNLPPRCPRDASILKPDFVFFGEAIPPRVAEKAFAAAAGCQVCLVVGSTGEVAPASYVPATAKQNRAFVIEINPEESQFTRSVTDLYLKGRAGDIFREIEAGLFE
jgi:NAD-dependent deacetylase